MKTTNCFNVIAVDLER